MTATEQAIRKAIEKGYTEPTKDFLINLPVYAQHQIWNDPSFWQALGKAMGWDYQDKDISGNVTQHGIKYKATFRVTKEIGWIYHWHRFIDHLASGKDPESFFAELLTKQN